MSSWVQPKGDPARRVTILHRPSLAETWTVDSAYTFFEGRTFPVGARGEHVARDLALTTVWSIEERPQAEAFLLLLRGVALEADARLDLHLDPPVGGTALDLVVEVHEVPQQVTPGRTDITINFRQVDG